MALSSSDEFTDIYLTFSQRIYSFFYWRVKDKAIAEDLTSIVFMKAWRSRSSFSEGSPQAWLYRIARNLMIDHWRSINEVAVENIERYTPLNINEGEQLDVVSRVKQLKHALVSLPEDLQTIITLRFVERLPVKEVAKRIGLTEGNVRVKQYRALKQMKEYLNEE